jgi:hypothetical protein
LFDSNDELVVEMWFDEVTQNEHGTYYAIHDSVEYHFNIERGVLTFREATELIWIYSYNVQLRAIIEDNDFSFVQEHLRLATWGVDFFMGLLNDYENKVEQIRFSPNVVESPLGGRRYAERVFNSSRNLISISDVVVLFFGDSPGVQIWALFEGAERSDLCAFYGRKRT